MPSEEGVPIAIRSLLRSLRGSIRGQALLSRARAQYSINVRNLCPVRSSADLYAQLCNTHRRIGCGMRPGAARLALSLFPTFQSVQARPPGREGGPLLQPRAGGD